MNETGYYGNVTRLERLYQEGWMHKSSFLDLIDALAHQVHQEHYGEFRQPVSLEKKND